MDWSESVYDRSFRDRMEDGKDAATCELARADGRLRARIVRTRQPLSEPWTVEQVAAAWGVSTAMVKRVLARGGVKGARRGLGKGSPWIVPARLQPDGSYQVERLRGARGPLSSLARAAELPF